MTQEELAELLHPLEKYLAPTPPHLPGFDGFAAVHGLMGLTNFIITVDHDGHVEVSLSMAGQPAPLSAARTFLEVWGVDPPESSAIVGRIRHYVVRRGKVQ